jgi:hypothetical protein
MSGDAWIELVSGAVGVSFLVRGIAYAIAERKGGDCHVHTHVAGVAPAGSGLLDRRAARDRDRAAKRLG